MKTKIISLAVVLMAIVLLAAVASCSSRNSAPVPQKEQDAIQKYLDTKVMEPAFGGKIFSAYKVFKKENNKIYIWAYLQEYYKKDGKTEPGSGWSVPLVLNVEENESGLKVISHLAPGDGELYAADIKKLFPKEIQQQIFDFTGTEEMRELENTSKERSTGL